MSSLPEMESQVSICHMIISCRRAKVQGSGSSLTAHQDFGHFYGSSYVACPDGSRTPVSHPLCKWQIDHLNPSLPYFSGFVSYT